MHSDFKKLLIEEQGRCFALLTTTDPATDSYETVLSNALRLESIINSGTFTDGDGCVVNPAAPVEVEPTPIEEIPAPTTEPAPVEEPEPAPVEEPKPVTPAPKPEPIPTKAEMVRKLSFRASEAGGNVDVAGIMSANGWANLSAVPESRYNDLLALVEEAAGVA